MVESRNASLAACGAAGRVIAPSPCLRQTTNRWLPAILIVVGNLLALVCGAASRDSRIAGVIALMLAVTTQVAYYCALAWRDRDGQVAKQVAVLPQDSEMPASLQEIEAFVVCLPDGQANWGLKVLDELANRREQTITVSLLAELRACLNELIEDGAGNGDPTQGGTREADARPQGRFIRELMEGYRSGAA